MANFKPAKLERTQAEPMADLLPLFVLQNGLWDGLYSKAVCDAWDSLSGAARYTVNRYLKDRVLYVAISSSVARNSLLQQKDEILRKINGTLATNDILSRCGSIPPVENIRMH